MKDDNSNSLIFMKSDILNIHLTNSFHRINASITHQSITADKFRMLSKFGPDRVVGIMGGCLGFSSRPDD